MTVDRGADPDAACPPARPPVTRRADRRELIAISAWGAGLVVVFALSSWRLSLVEFFPGEAAEALDFTKIIGEWPAATAQYVGVVVSAFALYLAAVALTWRRRLRLPPVVLFGFPVLFALALVPMYPPTASDLIHYHGSSRVLWAHGFNPLTVPPGEFSYPVTYYWSGQPTPYGPAWSLLSGVVTWPAGEHALAALHGFKVLAAASYLGCAYVVWRLVARLWPGDETLAVVAFAWNPFVLYRVVGNGHNDLVMMLCVLLGLAAFEQRRWTAGMVAVTLSVLVKYVGLLLAPLFVLYLWQHAGPRWRDRVRAVAEAGAWSALVAALTFLPFWEGLSTFDTVRAESEKLITSTAIAISVAQTGHPDDVGLHRAALGVLRWTFVAIAALLWWQSRHDTPRLIAASFSVLMLYLLLAAGWFRPWYLLWPVAVAALAPRSWLTVVVLAVTFFGSFADLIEQYRVHWDLTADYTRAVLAPILVVWVPLVAAWAAGILRWGSWSMGLDARAQPRGRRAGE
ncbi:MAG: glycosyltransferase 87 family protein [Dehalococcoidia bacterium]